MRQNAAGSARSKQGLSRHQLPAKLRHSVGPTRERDVIHIEKGEVLSTACDTSIAEDLREAYDIH